MQTQQEIDQEAVQVPVRVLRGRVLIFIVAYNAEKTIESVLRRIPEGLQEHYDVEVLIIDDSSQDETFVRSELVRRAGNLPWKINVLFNPKNQGYGGNQKIGFHYALENGFDWVALVHGDGQYAPECLPQLLEPLASGNADVVFGSRMLEKRAALKGGMPLYKYVGNKILTTFQNRMLGSGLSEFHSGYRLYAIDALKEIPFGLNSNDFHFDTEIIIQLVFAKLRIVELPIPTYYGDEVCHVNGMKYAWDVFKATLLARVQRFHIFFDPKYDCRPEGGEQPVEEAYLKALLPEPIPERASILLVGEVPTELKDELRAAGHAVSVKSGRFFMKHVGEHHAYNYIFLLDDSGLARDPDGLLKKLLEVSRFRPDLQIRVTVANIGFCLTRLLLLFGRFSYSRRGIINLKSLHFFTLRSARSIFRQNGFSITAVRGVPVPYRTIFSSRWLAGCCSAVHRWLIFLRPSLFGFQLVFTVSPPASLPYLLASAERVSSEKSSAIEEPR